MKWWQYIGLRKRVFIILGCLVLITFVGGAVMIWYTYQIGYGGYGVKSGLDPY